MAETSCGIRHPVNSKAYWDARFGGDWQSHDGRAQTAFFAHVALSTSPAWLLDEIRDRRLSICDWGCAIGDAARDLARLFPLSDVTGYDISEVAIAEGRRLFPGLDLVAGDVLTGERQFDVIFSSNTLEHFHDPDTILDRLGLKAHDFLWLLLPFQDPGGIEEHFVRFDYFNIRPRVSDDFVLTFFNSVDVSDWPGTQWKGKQVVLVYARPAALARIAVRGCEVSAPSYREAFVSPSLEMATSRLAGCTLRLGNLAEQQKETEISLAAAEAARMESEAISASASAAAEVARAEAVASSAKASAAGQAGERDRIIREELAELRGALRSAEEKTIEALGRRAAAEARATRAELLTREADEQIARTTFAREESEVRTRCLEAAISSALVRLDELRRSKAWRLTRLARYIRGELWNSGLSGVLQGARHVVHRLTHRSEAFPAEDHLADAMRSLQNQLARPAEFDAMSIMSTITQSAQLHDMSLRKERNLVSIVMPVYNHADLLPEAIAGILAQTYQDWELIVVDDGSHDAFDAAISPFFDDPRIRVFSQSNQRLPAALNSGFQHARGKYLTWTSADNIMLPRQLEELVGALDANPGVGLVFSDYEAIDDRGAPLQDPRWRAHNRLEGSALVRLPSEVTIANFHDTEDNFLGPSFLYRADAAAVVGCYDDSAFGGEDYDFWLRMHLVTRFRHVDKILYRYRVHDNTLSAKAEEFDIASNIRSLRNADHERRAALLADDGLAATGDTPWRDPWQYCIGAADVARMLYSAVVADKAAAICPDRVRLCVVDVPLYVVDPTVLRDFDIVVAADKLTYEWLRQSIEFPRRLLYGEPSELTAAIAHAAALRGFERRSASLDNRAVGHRRHPATLHRGSLPQHVLFLVESWRSGGLERIVLSLARALSARGIRATLGLASEAVLPSSLMVELSAHVDGSGIPAGFAFGGNEAALSRFVHDERVSHANLHHTLFGLDSLRQAGVASIYTFQNSYVWFDTAQRDRWRRALCEVDLCIAVSRQVASFAAGAFGLSENTTMRIIPNGVDVDVMTGLCKLQDETHSGEFQFINVASFNRVKMQHALLDAFAALAARRPQVRLTLLGPALDKQFFKAILISRRALSLEDNVEIIPGEDYTSTLRRVAAADCFVMPSAIEGWSLALTEAVGLGVPCIATDVGAAEDIRQRGAALRLVPPLASDPNYLPRATLDEMLSHPPRRFVDDLTSAMEAVMSDAADLKAKAQSAAARLRDAFSVARMADDYLEACGLARANSRRARLQ